MIEQEPKYFYTSGEAKRYFDSLFIVLHCDKFLSMQGIGTGSVDLSGITTFLFDLDGVLWRGDTPIEGAAQAVNKLREAGRKCLFCTNNSSRTTAFYVEKLKRSGLEVTEDDVLTSSWVTAHYLSGHFTGPFLAYVIGEEGIYSSLQKIGAHIVPESDLDGIESVDCVVVGIDREFNYQKLQHAQRLIQHGALFIATNRDGSYPVENGVAPGAGSIVAAVETASGITPVTVGKPRPVMVELAIQKFNLKPGEVALVGDRLDTDIACARRAGITAVCVLTGVTSQDKASRARGELRPHYIYANLTDMCGEALAQSQTEADSSLETSFLPELVAEPAATSGGSSFAFPTEETDAPASEEEAQENSPVDEIDALFNHTNGQAETAIPEQENALELDTAMSVAEEKEPVLPASQIPSSDEAEIDAPDEDAFDLDTALSVAQTPDAAPPPSQNSDSGKAAEKSSAEDFDWKLD
jgi:4-nitrophenyl phosphatase